MEIKDMIRIRRKELGYSLENLAHAIGVSKQTVQKWESGKIENLRHSNMFALSKSLNIPLELLANNGEQSDREKTPKKTFGEKLKEIRLLRNMSQSEFADLLHTSKQVVSRYELGQNTPKIDTVSTWCKTLGINIADLLDEQAEVFRETASARISKAIDKKGISYGELSKATGIPKSALHRYSIGETPKIPIDRIRLIARALDVSEAWLAGIETQDTPSAHEWEVIHAYREKPELQAAVNKLLLG